MKFNKKDVTGIIKLFTRDKVEQDKVMATLLNVMPQEEGMDFSYKAVEDELGEISAALDRLNLSEREVNMLVEALDRLYVKGMAHGAFLHGKQAKRPRRFTQNMIRNFTKLRTADVHQQIEITELLTGALPEDEPTDWYEEVAEMVYCLRDDFYRADPQNRNPEARMNLIRDHADALFIDGIVYGAFLAMQKYK